MHFRRKFNELYIFIHILIKRYSTVHFTNIMLGLTRNLRVQEIIKCLDKLFILNSDSYPGFHKMNSKIFQIIKLLWGINPLSFGNIRFLTIRKKPMSKKLYKYVFYVVSCFYKTLRVTWYRILSFIFMQTLLCIHGRGGRFIMIYQK